MRGVPLARRNLFQERRRALVGIGGVAVAFLLILVLDGIFAGSMQGITAYIDRSPADVFVAQEGVRNIHMASSALPADVMGSVRRVRGVAWAEPLLYIANVVRAGERRVVSYVFGYDPASVRTGPPRIVRGRRPGTGEIVLDEQAAQDLGVGLGDRVETMGMEVRVAGLARGLTNIVNTVSFIPFEDFAAAQGQADAVSYVLVGARSGTDPDLLARRITREVGHVTALSREGFSRQEARIVKDMTVELMQIMTLIALLIGLAVVGLTLYMVTLAKLREYGVVKALGARKGRLYGIVGRQAVWTLGVALVVALVLTVGVGALLGVLTPNVKVVLTGGSVLRVLLAGTALAVLGALAPVRKVAAVDPATVFRR